MLQALQHAIMPSSVLTEPFRTWFDHEIAALWERHVRPIQSQAAPGSSFYHYTTVDGAFEIIKSQTLWATNVLFLNDPTELYTTTDVLRQFARTQLRANGADPAWQRISAITKRLLEPIYSKDPNSVFPSLLFAASFTGLYDRKAPTHWAQYSQGSGGIALGFQANDMQNVYSSEQSPPLPCSYKSGAAKSFVIDVVNAAHGMFTEAAKHYQGAQLDSVDEVIGDAIGLCLGRLAPLFKQPALAHEREWRVTRIVQRSEWPLLVCHTATNGYKPYVELDLRVEQQDGVWRLPIKTITLGPKVSWELTSRALNSTLVSRGYRAGQVRILRSGMRLR